MLLARYHNLGSQRRSGFYRCLPKTNQLFLTNQKPINKNHQFIIYYNDFENINLMVSRVQSQNLDKQTRDDKPQALEKTKTLDITDVIYVLCFVVSYVYHVQGLSCHGIVCLRFVVSSVFMSRVSYGAVSRNSATKQRGLIFLADMLNQQLL